MSKFILTPVDLLAESATDITTGVSKNFPVVGNAAICADSFCTAGRASINFYCTPNPVAKAFFGASVICGVMGGTSSAAAITTSLTGIPVAGWFGALGARGFNRLGKYTLHMGNVTNGNITDVSEIAELMS